MKLPIYLKFQPRDFNKFVCGWAFAFTFHSLLNGSFLVALLIGMLAALNGLFAWMEFKTTRSEQP